MKKRYFTAKKIITTIILLIILFGIIYFADLFKKICYNEPCFDNALKECKATDYIVLKNNNQYLYAIERSPFQECKIKITFLKAAEGSEVDIVSLLEGKSMTCKIPKIALQDLNLNQFDNVLQYCHGELKEGIYELMIKRMYSLILGNLNEIVVESKELLKDV